MHIEPKYLNEILSAIKEKLPKASVYAFGSRVTGKNLKKYSDFDIVIDNSCKISLDDFIELKSKFSDSNIPFKIDISDYNSLEYSFKKIIDEQKVKIL